MRSIIIATLLIGSVGCENAEEQGRKAAQQRAAEETKREVATQAAVKISPPVPGRAHVPCEQLIDAAKFTEALAEVEPVSVRDETNSDPEAAAVCGVIRGGVRPDPKQQAAIIKKNAGRLGTIPGDELCAITAYCWTLEEQGKFETKCKADGFSVDESLGSRACLQVIQQGADDVHSWKFLDSDTKCMFKIRGGPSMIDNDLIGTCAKTARDLIGKDQIAVGGSAPAPTPAPATGSGAPSYTP